MDKTKWIRLIQWKFGGCRGYESVPLAGRINDDYVGLLPGKLSRANTERAYRENE
jgi:hypothetical protein